MNKTDMWFDFVICLPLYASSILYKKNINACICSWFCHEMTLPNVWYCFLYEKKYDCGCSKIMLQVSLSSRLHFVPLNTIALPVWLLYWLSGSVIWCELNSLLCCFSFPFEHSGTCFHFSEFVECMTINACLKLYFSPMPNGKVVVPYF